MATAPLRPNPFEKPENEVTPELELPEEDTESVIIHDDVEQESFLLEEEEEEEVLETEPSLQAEIDNNLEPDLFEPTPENYFEEVSDEETVVLNPEDQPEFLSDFEYESDSDSDDFGSPMTAPAA